MPATIGVEFSRNTLPLSDYICNLVFVGAAVKTVTVPAGHHWVAYSVTGAGNVFLGRRGLAGALPAADEVAGAGSFGNPTAHQVAPGQVLSFASDAACIVSIAFYPLRVP